MMKPLVLMVAIGAAIGIAWPSGDRAATSAVAEGSERKETILEREANGHFYVHATVNGELVKFLVDTGASNVALSEEDARRVGLAFSPDEFHHVGEGAAGPVQGKFVTLDSVDVDGKTVEKVAGVVLEGSRLSLLGQSYLSRMGEVQMRGNVMVLR